jgi:hypothetical protein
MIIIIQFIRGWSVEDTTVVMFKKVTAVEVDHNVIRSIWHHPEYAMRKDSSVTGSASPNKRANTNNMSRRC